MNWRIRFLMSLTGYKQNVYFCSKKLGQDTVKAISEGINDLMLLGLDNFFSENVDNDIDGATDNATLEEVQDFLMELGIKPLIHLVEISTF